ncbi:MAG: hypothetical protein Q8S52_12445 [Methylobacter sp.]|nr:hypothetical protein [Methylobacter sp.]MDP3362915.1 hypothetical protein [Methylobacter sp.]
MNLNPIHWKVIDLKYCKPLVEAKHFPVDLPDPVEAIKFRMEQSGLTPKNLVPMIGRLNRIYEILNRKNLIKVKSLENITLMASRNSETLHVESEHRCKLRATTSPFSNTPETQERQYEYHHAQIL